MLSEREQYVIQETYFSQKNFAEIGRSLNVTRERIRQIHKNIIKKLRKKLKREELRVA